MDPIPTSVIPTDAARRGELVITLGNVDELIIALYAAKAGMLGALYAVEAHHAGVDLADFLRCDSVSAAGRCDLKYSHDGVHWNGPIAWADLAAPQPSESAPLATVTTLHADTERNVAE